MLARERIGTPSHPVLALVGFVLVCLATGWIGSVFTMSSVDTWYRTLEKPSWTPPNWVFGPVWTALYIAMGVAAWRVWREYGFSGAPAAMTAFGVQLALNLLWSALFFGLRMPGLAAVEIVLLWAAVFATLRLFMRLDRTAGWLLIPYLAWVTYASSINFGVWWLNR